ncbi:MAG: 6-carboxytetrahydropterin synthase QueD [Candidatus Omnitrophota bacterium]
MFEIKVTGEFSSAHNLRGYRGKCEELHGHNWKAEVIVSGKKLDKTGMLMDFKKLKFRLNKILDKLDHKHLNRLGYFDKINPTSENIAKYIYDSLKLQTVNPESVTVWESDRSSATYYGE